MSNYMITGEYPDGEVDESYRADLKVLGYYYTYEEAEKSQKEFEDINFTQIEIVHIVPDSVKKSIKEVLEYLWKDEALHYAECIDLNADEQDMEGHIFRHLVDIDNFIYSNDKTPEDFIKGE